MAYMLIPQDFTRISILVALLTIISACAPICDPDIETAFVAEVISNEAGDLRIGYRGLRLKTVIDANTILLRSDGSSLAIHDLETSDRLYVRGFLLNTSNVHLIELRLQ